MKVALLICLMATVKSWNVLFLNPFAGGSHQTISVYLANLLAKRDHQVTYVSSVVPKNLDKAVASRELVLSSKFVREELATAPMKLEQIESFKEKAFFYMSLLKSVGQMCDYLFKDDFVQNMIKSKKTYDVVILFGILETCSLGLAHELKIPAKIIHWPSHLILATQVYHLNIPIYSGKDGYDGSFIKTKKEMDEIPLLRLKSLIGSTFSYYAYTFGNRFKLDRDVRNYVPDYPGYATAIKEVSLMFQHYSPLTDTPTTYGPGVIPLAGTLCTTYNYNDLGSELAEFMDGAVEGTIVVSFGSYSMSFTTREGGMLMEVFSRLPYKVVLKADPAPPNLPPNVKVLAWLPQQSLLQHPNVKLFITHGGYASKVEGLCAGVPLFVIPRSAPDQKESLKIILRRELGSGVPNLNKTTSDELYSKITKVMDDKELFKRVRRLGVQIKLTRTTEEQIIGYLDTAMSGYRLLPEFQSWWEMCYLDIILVPIATIWILRVIVRWFRK